MRQLAWLALWLLCAKGVQIDKVKLLTQTALSVWPVPASASAGTASASISAALQFVGDVQNPLVRGSIARYQALIFPHELDCPCDGKIKRARLVVKGDAGEGYSLHVNSTEILIEAESPAGVQYALETLSQLVVFDFDQLLYTTQPVLPLVIHDRPRFPHRGLLIDSSRHFLPVPAIKHLLDSMSYAKLNVLHWHITDSESFPLMSRVAPELSKAGAHSARERYSRADVASIVTHARQRSITVIPEFDMPGHVDSWAKSHPELYTAARDAKFNGVHGALNPSKDATFTMVDRLLADWLVGNESAPAFFDGSFVHLGGDEVPMQAWGTPEIRSFMSDHHLANTRDLFTRFLSRNVQTAEKLGKHVVLWDEAFEQSTRGNLPSSVTFQIWRDWGGLRLGQQATAAGYKIIASPTSRWYLDHIDTRWEDMYTVDPVTYLHIPQEHASRVVGGEGCMWGETVDPGNLEATIWPRLAAIAERLWSPAAVTTSAEAALPRLESFRCTLLERGVEAATVGSHLTDKETRRYAPSGPGSCSGKAPPLSFLQLASKKKRGLWEIVGASLSAVISGTGHVASAETALPTCACARASS